MNNLTLEILQSRSLFLKSIRSFFETKNFLEIDTPCLNEIAGMEPYLDPMRVSSPHKIQEGYLITSPEYSLKKVLSKGVEACYEISHCFRSGEKGGLHSPEFLMLEFYKTGIDEMELMEICIELLFFLQKNFFNFGFSNYKKISMKDLFYTQTGYSYSREDLLKILEKEFSIKNYKDYRYEDLFFLVFLNFIEPNFKKEFLFIYDYPRELSSLARIENGVSKRFELYFGRVELGNAFFELNDSIEQKKRFLEEQALRRNLNKEIFEIDTSFLESVSKLPKCSGIAIGLDRLLMVILGKSSLSAISPYFQIEE